MNNLRKIHFLKYIIPILATNFLIALTQQSSTAFTLLLNQSNFKYSQGYTYKDWLTLDDYEGYTIINNPTVVGVQLGGNPGLWKRLNEFSNANKGWKFLKAQKGLEGTLAVDSFSACGYGKQCGDDPNRNYGIGADIGITYHPSDKDPDIRNLRWIQRVTSNHKADSSVHGVKEDTLDQDYESQRINPYYYDRARSSGTFFDTPYRNDPQNYHKWDAELYLAEVTKQKGKEIVKIFNGIKWNWFNFVYPKDKNQCLTKAACNKGVDEPPKSPGYYTDKIGGGIGTPPTGYVPNDDGSFGLLPLGFSLNYFGKTYNDFYLNNNGNISFGKPIGAYTPNSFNTQNLAPMIAPFWADVDTRGTGTVAVRRDIPHELILTWDKVGYYSQHTDKLASFQLVLRDPNYPIPPGEGNLGFFYKDVQWETGDASGGTGGFGGTQASVRFSDGLSTVDPNEFSLPSSQQAGISQFLSNRYFWFNLPPSSSGSNNSGGCSGSSSGGGCPPPLPPTSCNGGGGCARTNTNRIFDNESVDQDLSSFNGNDANDPQYQDLSFFNLDGTPWTEDQEQSDYNVEDANWNDDEDVLHFQNYDNSKSPVSVPESTPALGLLALGAWGIIKAIKIRLEK
jgi:hypothetical protein